MGSVGYREVREHVAREPGEHSEHSEHGKPDTSPAAVADLEALIVRSTRIFARRQRTWLHHAAVTWL
jgi:hypothetical protein